ncbi:MAG TPA: hypothetical protein VJA26_05630, partial [Gammaproteobacteria bacterium]|nr:hypothetical protein [Gammaproteobacteria bacterium]
MEVDSYSAADPIVLDCKCQAVLKPLRWRGQSKPSPDSVCNEVEIVTQLLSRRQVRVLQPS